MANNPNKVIPGYWFIDPEGKTIPVTDGMNPAMDHVVVDINERNYRARVEGCSKGYVATEAQKKTASKLIDDWINRHESGFPAAKGTATVTVGTTPKKQASDPTVPEMIIELPKGGLKPDIVEDANGKIDDGFKRIFAAPAKTEKPADNPPATASDNNPPAPPAKTEKPADNPPAKTETEKPADNPPAKTETEKPADNPPAAASDNNPPAPPAKAEQPEPAKTEWRYDSSKSPRQNILERLGAVEGF